MEIRGDFPFSSSATTNCFNFQYGRDLYPRRNVCMMCVFNIIFGPFKANCAWLFQAFQLMKLYRTKRFFWLWMWRHICRYKRLLFPVRLKFKMTTKSKEAKIKFSSSGIKMAVVPRQVEVNWDRCWLMNKIWPIRPFS